LSIATLRADGELSVQRQSRHAGVLDLVTISNGT
jgi:hypothetical protein